jgi:hypothetical protein
MPTEAELRSARLTVADLGAGFHRDRSETTSGESTSTSSDPACTGALEMLVATDAGLEPVRKARSAFASDSFVLVENTLGAWRTKAPAVKGIAGLRALLGACVRWTETDAEGMTATIRIRELTLPELGSDRVGIRARITLSQDATSVTARVDFVVVRVRNAATFLSVVRIGAATAPDVVDLSRLSTKRLRAVL